MIKDIKNIDNKGKNMSLIDVENVSSKISRLVTAVYMVAQCISEEHEIRSLIVHESVNLLSSIKDFEFFEKDRHQNGVLVSRSLSYIKSLLDVALAVKYVSAMNYSVITNQIRIIQSLMKSVLNSASWSDSRLDLHAFFEEAVDENIKDTKGQIKDIMSFTKQNTSKPEHFIRENSPDRDNRLNKIMEYLKNNQKSNIKDISMSLGQISEKTVQRDLTALVSEGKVVRQGERRWSTYSLGNI